MLFSTTRKAQTSGVLLPSSGVIKVVAIQNGEVIDKRVKEGQKVKAGEVLYVLRSERQSQGGAAVTENQQSNVAPVDAQKTISAFLQKRRDSFGAELKQSGIQGQQKLAALQRVKASNQRESSSTEAEFNDAKIVTSREQATLQCSATLNLLKNMVCPRLL